MKRDYFKAPKPPKVDTDTKIRPITLQGLNGVMIIGFNKKGEYFDAEGKVYTQDEILKPAKKK